VRSWEDAPERRKDPMLTDSLTVLLIGPSDDLAAELSAEAALTVQTAASLSDGLPMAAGADAVVVVLQDEGPLETLEELRLHTPDAAVVVVTPPGRETDGTVALHAGAEDHLSAGDLPRGLLGRAIGYAVANRRLRRELSTTDEETGLPNLRGFVPIAEHHLRLADRTGTPVVFLFVRLEGLEPAAKAEEVHERIGEVAGVLLEAVRDADVAARVGPGTFCVLLTGGARGAEGLVLSRLVEAIAVHDARGESHGALSVSVGTALYDPEQGGTLESILAAAERGLETRRPANTPADG
jgi:diguanylate cyclase (GGDEF)-like protein